VKKEEPSNAAACLIETVFDNRESATL